MLWVAQFGVRGIEHGQFGREARRDFLGRGQRTRAASSTLVLKWRRERARGVHVAWRLWQQAAACLHACARRCSRGGCAGQGPVILIGSL